MSFKWMVEQDDTGDHTIVCRAAIQRQGLQSAVVRVWKDELAKTGRLLRQCTLKHFVIRVAMQPPRLQGTDRQQ